ncbi:MAG: amidohydrolase family protein [Deltaproteobacteria bacterium]|nr:amidohydrolase family protein [Deltaproteobacteria bacterium]MBI3390756.1 amidohydrolase family protein [Deltaproteobacteria bacterium]
MTIRPILILAVVASVAVATGCSATKRGPSADTIYTGGDIITINDAQPTVEAVAVKDGKILSIGARSQIDSAHKGATTTVVDLAGKTLLPGFLDPHSHYFSALSVANQVNVFAPPAGPGKDIPSIVAEIKKFRDEQKVHKGELIQAYGYDDNAMPNGVGLTRDDLDLDFADNPVLVGHVSMHGAVLNSAAMKQYGISAKTKTPPGGIILRKAGSNEPAGLLMETAFLPIFASLPKPNAEQEVAWSRAGQMLYAAAGITTAQEGATHASELALMQRAAAAGANSIDVVAYPFVTDFDAVIEKNPVNTWGKYVNRVKLGGAKITLDGSIQGKTACFTTPYLTGGPGGEKNWKGEPGFPEDYVKAFVKKVYDFGLPLNAHANGDAAIDMLLRAHEYAAAGDLSKQRHVTVIHSQMVRPDQLDKYVAYKMTPSFFTEHAYYFADTHLLNRGKEQTFFLSPMRAAIDKGLRPTNHTDFVVTPLDQMLVIWTAVNRISRNGVVIGPDQRITPMEALKAITINVANQYGEEQSKGSLEPGKLADLVILDKNPLTVDPMTIKDIKVVETIKEGKTIYKAKRASLPARRVEDSMKIFIAGGTGAIGRVLMPLLASAGHKVVALTRSADRASQLERMGAVAVVGDVYDPVRLAALVVEAEPEVVIHQLTAFGAKDADPLAETIRVRTEGTRNLVSAAHAAGARRFIAQSISFICSPGGSGLTDEDTPLYLDAPPAIRPLAEAIASLERQTLEANGMAAIVLRYGWFYGPGTNYDPEAAIPRAIRMGKMPIVGAGAGTYSFINLHDAAAATVKALTHDGQGIYNIVDDSPARLSEWLPFAAKLLDAPAPTHMDEALARQKLGDMLVYIMNEQRGASNAKAKRELQWEPRIRSWREGFSSIYAASRC